MSEIRLGFVYDPNSIHWTPATPQQRAAYEDMLRRLEPTTYLAMLRQREDISEEEYIQSLANARNARRLNSSKERLRDRRRKHS